MISPLWHRQFPIANLKLPTHSFSDGEIAHPVPIDNWQSEFGNAPSLMVFV
jgi:hypothetical protein